MKVSKCKQEFCCHQKNQRLHILLLWALFFIVSFSPFFAYAWTFDPHNIFTDTELRDKDSISKTAIQVFLEREGSVLRNYQQNVNGENKTATQMIWEVSQNYSISPKFLLATLEKEKGLIQKDTATEKDFDWATGYSCFSGSCNEKYRGFFNQIESTAITQNIYTEKSSSFQFRPNQTATTKDGYAVTPKNQATANLYIYTPYIGYAPDQGYTNIEKSAGRFGANYLFWQIWTRYFSEKKIPNGFVIKNEGNFWRIESGKKRKFDSYEIFIKDYNESDAIYVPQKTLNAYEDGSIIYFSQNTLARSSANNQAYLLTNGVKRPILDNSGLSLLSDFRLAASSLNEIPLVENYKLEFYQAGNPIDGNSSYPQGKLFRNENGSIFLIQDKLKYPIDSSVVSVNFKNITPEPISSSMLESYVQGSAVLLKDGSVVKNSQGSIYLISDKEKIKIKNPEIFPKIFGEPFLQAVVAVPDSVLALHNDSLNISYADDSIKDSAPLPPAQPPSYSAEFESMEPVGLVMFVGQKKRVEIRLKNIGGTEWKNKDIWLEVQGKNEPVYFQESQVPYGGSATFSLDVEAPQKIGLHQIYFGLYYLLNGQKQSLLSFGKFILVQGGDTAEIISHNLPIAVKNTWGPRTIKMKIKNTSAETLWLSRKTALELYDGNNNFSPFFDPKDWVRKEVVGVPLNKSSIKPGEAGEFTFTLKPQGVKPGVYSLQFKLNLLDKNKQVYLNGEEYWIKPIRIDK